MAGARPAGGKTFRYPRDEAALARGAGLEEEAASPQAAAAGFPHWQPGRPPAPGRLPRDA
jgi:hypothetical protein